MNCIVNLAAVGSGDIGISYCQEVSTAGFCSAISLREDTGWGLKQSKYETITDKKTKGENTMQYKGNNKFTVYDMSTKGNCKEILNCLLFTEDFW